MYALASLWRPSGVASLWRPSGLRASVLLLAVAGAGLAKGRDVCLGVPLASL